MSSLMSKQIDYFPTESDLAELFKKAGLPQDFSNKFIKDYAAIKRNVDQNAEATDENTLSIESLDARVDSAETAISALTIRVGNAESAISAIDIRLTTAEGEISTLRIDLDQLRLEFDTHVAAQSAHGATGDIVGTDDYATSLIGGTVLLAAAVADAAPSAATPPAAVAAAPAAYSQAYTDSQTNAINALSTALAQVIVDYNAVVTQLNALLASERAAKQLAP